MLIFTNLTASAVCVLLCLFQMRSFFAMDDIPFRKYAAPLGIGWAVLSAAALLWDHILVTAGITALTAGVLCRLAAYPAHFKKVVIFGLAFGIMRLAASAAAFLLAHYFSADGPCVLLMEVITLYALVAFVSAFSERWYPVSAPLLQLVPVWLLSVILCVEVVRNQRRDNVVILEVLSYVWLIYGGAMLLHVAKRIDAQVRKYQKEQQKARHYLLREEYYQQLRDKQTETRALWHDLNKYLRAAKAEAPSVQALSQLEDMLNSATEIVDVGNQVLNVILNEYAQAAKAAGILLRLKVRVPPKLPVSVADLYILIGNTMDNAIEACGALPAEQRVIDLTLRTHHDVLYYKLMNPYNTAISKHAAEPMRGHGIPNVRRCVDHYDGSLEIIDENGFYTVSAHLNIDCAE